MARRESSRPADPTLGCRCRQWAVRSCHPRNSETACRRLQSRLVARRGFSGGGRRLLFVAFDRGLLLLREVLRRRAPTVARRDAIRRSRRLRSLFLRRLARWEAGKSRAGLPRPQRRTSDDHSFEWGGKIGGREAAWRVSARRAMPIVSKRPEQSQRRVWLGAK